MVEKPQPVDKQPLDWQLEKLVEGIKLVGLMHGLDTSQVIEKLSRLQEQKEEKPTETSENEQA